MDPLYTAPFISPLVNSYSTLRVMGGSFEPLVEFTTQAQIVSRKAFSQTFLSAAVEVVSVIFSSGMVSTISNLLPKTKIEQMVCM